MKKEIKWEFDIEENDLSYLLDYEFNLGSLNFIVDKIDDCYIYIKYKDGLFGNYEDAKLPFDEWDEKITTNNYIKKTYRK